MCNSILIKGLLFRFTALPVTTSCGTTSDFTTILANTEMLSTMNFSTSGALVFFPAICTSKIITIR